MTMQSMEALILKRAFDTKKIINAKDLLDQGYSLAEIVCCMYAVTMAQVKKDIVPITIAETVHVTGASVEHVTELMKNHLKMKTETKDEKLKRLYGLLKKAEKDGDDIKWNLIAQEIAAIEG